MNKQALYIDSYTKVVLTIIAVSLFMISINPWRRPKVC